MRDRIKALALDLLVQHGYRGVSFGDLAKALDTTRANIHYHFGTKQALVEEVLDDYIRDTTNVLTEIWKAPDTAFADKIAAMVEYSRQRYLRYNSRGRKGRPWSLIARMRQDSDLLTAKSHAALRQFGKDLNEAITAALEAAKETEFVASMPTEDVALHLVSIANSASPITQDAGNFERLEQLYAAFTRIIVQAFGRDRAGVKGPRRPVATA